MATDEDLMTAVPTGVPPSPRRAPRGAAERRHPALLSRPRRGRGGGDRRLPEGYREEPAASCDGASRASGTAMTECDDVLSQLLLGRALDADAAAHVSA